MTRQAAAVGVALAALVALLGWPVPIGMGSHALGGGGGDFHAIAWGLWARPLGRIDTVLHPLGSVLVVSNPPEVFLLAPLTWLFGPVATHNLWQLLHVGLAGGLAYALCRREAGPAGSVAGAVAFGLCGVLLGGIHNGNADVTPLYWLPAVALLGGRPVLAGLAAGVGAWCNPYVGVGCAVVLAACVPWRAWWKALPAAGVVAGAYLALMRWSLGEPGTMVHKTVGEVRGASLSELVWAPGSPLNDQGTVDVAWLGVVAVGLAVAGLGRSRWVLVALVGAGLATGPAWLAELPGLDALRIAYRYAALASLGVAVLVARGVERLPGGWIWVLVLASDQLRVGAELVASGPVRDDTVCELLAGREPGPVLNVPAELDERYLLDQTCHGFPVGSGLNRRPGPQLMRAAQRGRLDVLREQGFRYLIHHRREGPEVVEL